MSTEVKKTVHSWFLGFASLLLAIALGVLFSAASDLTDASMQFNALTVKQPRFADFVGPQRYDMLMKKATKRPTANPAQKANTEAAKSPIDPAKAPPEPPKAANPPADQPLALDAAIQRTFEFFSEYENKLSKPSLQIIKPVVAAIETGSPAEQSGIKVGDTILTVGGTKLESVMGFYLALSDKPSPELSLRVLRDKRELNIILRSPKGIIFHGNNTGIKFALPEDVFYITEQDAKRLAEQYKNDFMSTIPADWRADAANNLMQMARQLNNLGTEMVDLNNAKPIRIKSSDLIAWQHKRWSESLEDYFSQRRLLENKVIEILGSFGDAISGLVAALLFFGIALLSFLYNRSFRHKSSA